jgi:hypothetical protein
MQNTYQTEEIEEHCRSTNQLKRANETVEKLILQ